MKHLSLVVAFWLLCAASVFAGHDHSILHLRLHNQAPFKVILDNLKIEGTHNALTLPELEAGTHLLKVVEKSPYWQARKEVVFYGYVDIAPGREIFAYIDHLHRFRIHQEVVLQPVSNNPYTDAYNNPYINPYVNGYTESWEGSNSYPYPEENTYPYPPANSGNSNSCTPSPPPPCTVGTANVQPIVPSYMSPSDFTRLKKIIRTTSYHSGKLDIAKQAISQNWLNSEQVKELMGLFAFDNYRLKLAKFAFARTVDPERYYLVFDALKYNSSIRRLKEFIAAG